MKISIKEIIDDILLLVRNNNISESEDLSRAQIAAWIKHYRHQLWKERKDYLKEKFKNNQYMELMDLIDNEILSLEEIQLELEDVPSKDGSPSMTRRSIETIDDVFNNVGSSILSIHDEHGEVIQYMDHVRRYYNNYRKYTFGEMSGYFLSDKHIYVEGLIDAGLLKYVSVLYIAEHEEDEEDDEDDTDDPDEDDIKVPGWMVPTIKQRIMNNELAFMLNRPSDDSNNATLASVKPHGPQDDEE